jgi:hypothetical protein
MKPIRFGSTRNLRRLACIASMPFVFAFIAFNILDLDGSNLGSLSKCFDRLAIEGDIAASPRVDPFPERVEYLNSDRTFTPNDPPDYARFQTAEIRALSRLEKARNHLYHVSLPRDSVPG